jgi:hypothetical protein
MKRILTSIVLFIWLGTPLLQAQVGEDFGAELFKENTGKIIFSNKIINLTSYNGDDSQENFDLLDEIYALAILKTTLAQSYKDNKYEYDFDNNYFAYNYALILYVNEDKKAQWLYELSETYFNDAYTLDLVLSSNDPIEKRNNSDFINDWISIISTLKEGKNTFKLEIIPLNVSIVGDKHPVLASGTFTLNMEKAEMDNYKEKKTTDLPPITMVNKSIEEKILVASKGIYPYTTPLKVFITDIKEDWSYATNDIGNIVGRQIIASVVYRTNTSNKCRIKTGIYMQKHQRFGNFDPMEHFKETTGYYDYQIPCWKVK